MTFTRIFHRGPTRLRRRRTPISVGLAGAVLVATCVTGAAAEGSKPVQADGSASAGKTITAHHFAQVAPLDPPGSLGHITSLEGPAFGPDGDLYMVHSTAPADQPKVIALDLGTRKVRGIRKDPTSLYASLQFSPADGRIYLTDLTIPWSTARVRTGRRSPCGWSGLA
jgi:lactonase